MSKARAPTASGSDSESLFARIVVDGRAVAIEYAWIGASDSLAPLIVFLHEGLGSVAMWRNYPRQLCAAAGARGLVFSRPGYGRSTPRAPAEKWPVDFMHRQADDVLPALFAVLGMVDRPWLFGHSDGASIALLYAAAHPARVAGVIAVAPHVFVEEMGIRSLEAIRATYLTSTLRESLARYHADPDSAFWGWNDVWLDPAFRAWNIEDRLPAIRCPLLAVQSDDDEYGTMAQLEGIARRVPHARLHKLRRGGHSPHRTQPAALTEAVVAFLRAHGVPARAAAASGT